MTSARRRDGTVTVLSRGRIFAAVAAALLLWVLQISTIPAYAAITAPSSRSVTAGGAVSVTVSTDQASIFVSNNSGGQVSVGPGSGAGPSVTFTFTTFTSTPAGAYSFTFTDGQSSSGFTLNVAAAPPTTTTSAPTTTTRPTTTTTRPPTTTTTVPETTTTVPETTTTVPETTTTVATTTTVPPTTTTTLPPTTTTSTLVPAGIAAPDSGDSSSGWPVPVIAIGAVIAALVGAAAYVVVRSGRSSVGVAVPASVVAWRRNRERRRVSRTGRGSKSSSIALWWQTSGPAAAWHDRQSSRRAEKNIRRQIEERQRLRKHQE